MHLQDPMKDAWREPKPVISFCCQRKPFVMMTIRISPLNFKFSFSVLRDCGSAL
jgi:hypothetical protein